MSSHCGEYVGEQYVQSPLINNFHRIYRFGRTNDISKPIVGVVSWGMYISGILAGPIIICIFFIAWSVLMLVFKCMGQTRVGFLSGNQFVEQKSTSTRKMYERPIFVRLTFLVSASIMIIFSSALISIAQNTIFDVADYLFISNKAFQNIFTDAERLINIMLNSTATLIPLRDHLVEVLDDEFCSREKINNLTGNNILLLENIINSVAEDKDGRISALQKALISLKVFSDKFQLLLVGVQSFTNFRYHILIFLSSFPVFFIFGILMAWKGKLSTRYQLFSSWFLLPLFIIMITLIWIVCALILVLAILSADLCSGGEYPGSPAGTIENILRGSNKSILIIELFQYYAKGCARECPFYFLSTLDSNIYVAETWTLTYLDNLKGPVLTALTKECPNKDFTPIINLLESISYLLGDLADKMKAIVDSLLYVLNCERIHSMFAGTVDVSFCFYLSTGLIWILTFLLIISFCGMTMIMLRASWLDVKLMKT